MNTNGRVRNEMFDMVLERILMEPTIIYWWFQKRMSRGWRGCVTVSTLAAAILEYAYIVWLTKQSLTI